MVRFTRVLLAFFGNCSLRKLSSLHRHSEKQILLTRSSGTAIDHTQHSWEREESVDPPNSNQQEWDEDTENAADRWKSKLMVSYWCHSYCWVRSTALHCFIKCFTKHMSKFNWVTVYSINLRPPIQCRLEEKRENRIKKSHDYTLSPL